MVTPARESNFQYLFRQFNWIQPFIQHPFSFRINFDFIFENIFCRLFILIQNKMWVLVIGQSRYKKYFIVIYNKHCLTDYYFAH